MIKQLAICLFSIASAQSFSQADTMKTVTIGSQQWTQFNLRTVTFQNGDSLFFAKNAQEWTAANRSKKPAFCYLNFDEKNADKFGLYYNFYAVSDPRGLAPTGFHIPKTEEWNKLKDYVQTTYKGDEGKFIKQVKSFKGGKATNETGLSILPSCIVNYDGFVPYKGTHAYFWTSNALTPKNEAFYAFFPINSDKLFLQRDLDLGCGMSVRCIKN